jgi:hypothetical protein
MIVARLYDLREIATVGIETSASPLRSGKVPMRKPKNMVLSSVGK